jgi:hypothetical protein
MISLVLSARNDGYGGNRVDIENFAMRRLKITLSSIQNISPKFEIVVVEWAPDSNRKPIIDFIKTIPAKIITVDPQFQIELQKNNTNSTLNFYEYVAKHIGILRSQFENIIICNPDNIFPKGCFSIVQDAFKKRDIIRAIRKEIHRNNVMNPIKELLKSAEDQTFNVRRDFNRAAGDFCGFTKQQYFSVGGFARVHGNAGCDNEILNRFAAKGYHINQRYHHYHINHDYSGSEAPGRSKTFLDHKKIPDYFFNSIEKYINKEVIT